MRKIKIGLIMLVAGIVIFALSLIAFVINACTASDVTLAWILFGGIMLGLVLFIVSIVILFIANIGQIKQYLNSITKL